MKVVHLIYSFNPGGVEMFLSQLTSALSPTGVETHFISFFDGPLRWRVESAGAKVYIVGNIKLLKSTWHIFKLLKKICPDVVNNHMLIYSGMSAMMCRILKIPFILYSHSTRKYDFNAAWIYKLLVNVSLFISKRLQSKGIGVSIDACKYMWGEEYIAKNAEYVSLGIDLAPYRPQENSQMASDLRDKWNIPADYSVVANVAGYRPSKNYSLFINVAAEILKYNPKVRFLMIGEGSGRIKMETLIRQYGIEDACILTGFVSNVPDILKSVVDVFFFPSNFEGLGLALVEAQAAGVPCVYSDKVPEEAVIMPSICRAIGLDVPIEDWSDAIIQKISGQKSLPVNKEVAYKIALNSTFNIQKTVNTYIRIWNSLKK